MPDRTDIPLTFGQRVRRARERAGLSRPVLAGLVDRSTDWVKSIENGSIGMPRLPMLLRLGEVLGVDDLADLTGERRISSTTYGKTAHADLPLVKRALATYQLAPRDEEPEPLDTLMARVRRAWRMWHRADEAGTTGHRSRIAQLLPDLLADTRYAVKTYEGPERRRALVAQAQAYHLAQLFLSFQPAPDLVMLTGDRAMAAAQDADSPKAIAAAAWYMNHVYRDAGEATEARVELVEAASGLLRRDQDPEDLARWGLLQLAAALSFARIGRHGQAWRYWDRADHAAERLGDDYAHPWLIFGRGIVHAYKLTMHNDLTRPGEALDAAASLDLSTVPSATRRSYHLIEAARAYGRQGEAVAAVHLLRKAWEESPETVQYNNHARSALPDLVRSAPPVVREDARRLALEVGVPV
ncbi:helix-turn-helix transcriptional regulator [Streptomyces sp. TRM76323]|uniref:Helix-turn-helix transcriptional regulator n=1 Tax=Streptomyces tamarix TaxID=3078565 RepID=A0ABU3QEN7_9ACTN|nr:helix-turn-helix transcriptional regulator [Streptomyces tamarix]MDT9681186.1 helix-turn-helix transcriptional regulator [Streptomyces tamarix]